MQASLPRDLFARMARNERVRTFPSDLMLPQALTVLTAITAFIVGAKWLAAFMRNEPHGSAYSNLAQQASLFA
jgi:hypothetical protein